MWELEIKRYSQSKIPRERDWQPTIDGFQILEEKEAMGQNAWKRTK